MRVGVNTLFFIPGEVGGSETYLRRTLVSLNEVAQDIELVLFTNKENHDLLKSDMAPFPGVELVPLGFAASNRYARIIREQVQLPRAARNAKLDVLWSPGYTAPRYLRCPQVLSILDMQYKRCPQDLSWLARTVTDLLIKAACQRCELILAISDFTRTEIIRYLPVAHDRVRVTPLGVDESFSEELGEQERALRTATLVGTNDPFLLCVANTYPHKNVHVAVEAFDLVAAEVPHHLVLVGKPRRGEPALQDRLARSPYSHRIHRLEGLSHQDLVDLYRGADVFVFPSSYEGFGLPILEAMAAGTPVISTDQASIPEVAGGHAALVPPNEAEPIAREIRTLLAEGEATRTGRAQDARAWAGRFTWQASAQATWAALQHARG